MIEKIKNQPSKNKNKKLKTLKSKRKIQRLRIIIRMINLKSHQNPKKNQHLNLQENHQKKAKNHKKAKNLQLPRTRKISNHKIKPISKI